MASETVVPIRARRKRPKSGVQEERGTGGVGMTWVGELEDDMVLALIGVVKHFGGQVSPDRRITFPDSNVWPEFVREAKALGVRFKPTR